jgi:hypothetical protein
MHPPPPILPLLYVKGSSEPSGKKQIALQGKTWKQDTKRDILEARHKL